MNKDIKMTSSRPYLLRAIYEWIVDNNMTPYLLVDATAEAVQVPNEHVNNGKIILNISPAAVMGLDLGAEVVSFNARFSGKPMFVNVPMKAVLAIYSKENGRGMVFTEDDGGSPEPGGSGPGPGSKESKQPTLRVVK
ncbi:MAG: ClpXP protease specificity-enhancing factor [Gammaproteobacteria bacterium]|jgi:stringent starvation protein B